MNYFDNDYYFKKEIPSSEKMFRPILLAPQKFEEEGSIEQINIMKTIIGRR